MAGDASRQHRTANGQLHQTEKPAPAQAFAHHQHTAGQRADALPALDVLLWVIMQRTFDAFNDRGVAHDAFSMKSKVPKGDCHKHELFNALSSPADQVRSVSRPNFGP